MASTNKTLSFGTQGLGFQLLGLTIGTAAILGILLTAQGYFAAATALRGQAATALVAGGRGTVDGIDTWNESRLRELRSLAAARVFARVLEPGFDKAKKEDVDIANELMKSLAGSSPEIQDVGIMDSTGKFVATTDGKTVGTVIPQRDYFKVAMDGKDFTTGASISTTTNNPAIFHSTPIKTSSGQVIGVLRSRSGLEEVIKLVQGDKDRVGLGAQGVLVDQDSLVVTSTLDPKANLKPVVELAADAKQKMADSKRWGNNKVPDAMNDPVLHKLAQSKEPTSGLWTTAGTDYQAAAIPLRTLKWTYVAGLPVNSVSSGLSGFLKTVGLAATFLIIGAAILFIGALRQLVVRPLQNIVETMQRVASSEYGARCEVFADDEMGVVATQINETLDNVLRLVQSDEERVSLQRNVQQVLEAVSLASDGDFSKKVPVTADVLGNVADALNLMFENIAQIIGKIRDGASRVNGAAGAIQSESSTLAAGSRNQVQDLARATSAVQQMAVRINEVADSASQTAQAADTSRERAMAGREQVRQVIDGMEGMRSSVVKTLHQIKGLGDRSLEISKIVDTITQIAGQTDLLALNAAIEAARAGEQGRGFAVVAEEVRRLAERSSEAAKEISDLVGAIQQQTTESVRAMDDTAAGVERQVKAAYSAGATLEAIAELSQRAAELIASINKVAQQQVSSANEVVQNVDAAAGISQRTATNIEGTSATTTSLVRLADELNGVVQQFTVN
ncbi:MAG: methyl-accepting chemotaxis protein [Myxococcales bacterium]|nr:methyl-accepting chemotaxis protein [Myxococcales bacterium]